MIDINKIKVVAADMDNTITNIGGTIRPETNELFKALKSRGILFVPSTGRPRPSIVQMFEPFDIDLKYTITMNGSLVHEGNEVIYCESLKREEYEYFVNYGLEHDICTFLHGISRLHFITPMGRPHEPNYFLEMCRSRGTSGYDQFHDMAHFIRSLDEIDEPINKVELTLKPKDDYKEIVKDLNENTVLEIVSAVGFNVEGTKKGTSKGKAIQILMNRLNISPDEIIVCGDSGNDIEMMKMGCHNICPSNAQDGIKEVCEVITDSCANFGIDKYLINLIKEDEQRRH